MGQLFTGSISIRGMRGPIPSGYVVGRTDSGSGPPHLISWAGIGQKLMTSGVPVTRLSSLQDVAFSTLTNKQHLEYNATAGKWVNVAAPALATLTDVDTTGLLTGQGLQYNGTKWVPHTPLLSEDGDVAISSPANLQVLQYNSGTGKWANATVSVSATLAGLTDVQLTSLADTNILSFNSASGKWKNITLPTNSTVLTGSLSATQTGNTNGVFGKVLINSIPLDTLSAWDNVNHRYKPPAGLYLFVVTCAMDVVAGGYGGAALYKNGTQVVNNLVPTGSGAPGVGVIQCVATVDFNGTTDYVEVFAIGSGTSPSYYLASPTPNITGIRLTGSGGPSSGSSTLAGDTDVLITSPANNDLLTFDLASGKWKNKPSSGAVKAAFGAAEFNAHAGSSFGAGNFGGRSIFVRAGTVITGIQFYAVTASGTTQIAPSIYADSAGSLGAQQAVGPTVTGVVQGINTLPLTTPYVAAADVVIWIGFVAITAAVNMATAASITQQVFFSQLTLPPPATPGAGTYASGVAWGSMWGVGTAPPA